jgi:hypothetical protein
VFMIMTVIAHTVLTIGMAVRSGIQSGTQSGIQTNKTQMQSATHPCRDAPTYTYHPPTLLQAHLRSEYHSHSSPSLSRLPLRYVCLGTQPKTNSPAPPPLFCSSAPTCSVQQWQRNGLAWL